MSRVTIAETVDQVGQEITIQGWVDTKRDHGKVTFVDLRDRTGVIQCVGFQQLREVSTESVLSISGLVKERPASMVNKELKTGSIELEVKSYEILNMASELPIPISGDGKDLNEEIRLKYRYLDLRRTRLQKILTLRSDLGKALRTELAALQFTEVETPMLTKSTKEGSRDFVVPSRFQPGKFYALPQSPQQYKQLLMTAGVEKYFQFARCIRDEDLRADRGFEHTQLDLEMSFVDQETVMETVENIVKKAISAVGGKLQQEKFPVISYEDAMSTYGADKFDLRTPEEKQQNVLAFAWVIKFPFFKKVDTADVAEVRDGKSGWTFTHNPFSMPMPEDLEKHLAGREVEQITTTQYDLVCNGYEVGGGSIRAHQAEILEATFKIMGYSASEIEASVGHMLAAFKVGTPPHGGIALGVDRLVMLLAGESSLKEAIAFPMSSSGRTAVMDAPTALSTEQLTELQLQIKDQSGLSPHDRILQQLHDQACTYQYLVHEPVMTSEDSARVRGGKIEEGAKALVMQADQEYIMVVIPGNKKADLDKIKAQFQFKKLAMASKESVTAKTSLEVGSIPPFGSLFGMKTILDPDLNATGKIAFNAGRHDRSIIMGYDEYLLLEQPWLLE